MAINSKIDAVGFPLGLSWVSFSAIKPCLEEIGEGLFLGYGDLRGGEGRGVGGWPTQTTTPSSAKASVQYGFSLNRCLTAAWFQWLRLCAMEPLPFSTFTPHQPTPHLPWKQFPPLSPLQKCMCMHACIYLYSALERKSIITPKRFLNLLPN